MLDNLIIIGILLINFIIHITRQMLLRRKVRKTIIYLESIINKNAYCQTK